MAEGPKLENDSPVYCKLRDISARGNEEIAAKGGTNRWAREERSPGESPGLRLGQGPKAGARDNTPTPVAGVTAEEYVGMQRGVVQERSLGTRC
jgi:hypothetical protein